MLPLCHADEYVDALNATFCYSPRQIFSSYHYTRLRNLKYRRKTHKVKGHRHAPLRQMFSTLWHNLTQTLKRSRVSSETQPIQNKYNIPVHLFSTLTFFNGFVITICFGLLCALNPTDDRYIWGLIWPRSPPLLARFVGFFWECFDIWHAWSCIIFHAETVLIMVCGVLEHLHDINNGKYSTKDAIKLYRGLLILTNQINVSCSNGILFGHTVGMSLIQISGIYVTIKLMAEIGYPTALLFPACVTTATFVCTFLYGWISELSQFSQAAVRKLLTEFGLVKLLEKKELKSLRPIRLKSGPFYYFTESTAFTYMNFVTDKTVLFLIL